MRIAFGNRHQFLDVLKQQGSKATPEAIRKKQEALLAMVEAKVSEASIVMGNTTDYTGGGYGAMYIGILQLYAIVLASLAQPPKSNPLENLERLEKLVGQFKEES